MHEMAVTANVLHLAMTEAERAGARCITKITLVIGELSSVMDESVQLYFTMLAEGTLAEDAELVFKRLPATLRCPDCGQTYPKEGSRFECPHCGAFGRLTGDAKDFYIESIEVE